MNVVPLLLGLLLQNADYAPAIQSSADAQRREIQLRQVAADASHPTPSVAEDNRKEYAAAHDQQFVEKFNKLIAALMEFSDTYKNGGAMDVQKAKAVRKAWLELEKSEALFRDNKKR
jgi:hypothetical protein